MKHVILFTIFLFLLSITTQNSRAANPGDVVINEIAWGGTNAYSGDEWIELYNTTSQQIDISGWTLQASDGTPNISLSGPIPANGFFLLERTNNTTVSDISADKIYTGSLHNDGENLTLQDDIGTLIDQANFPIGTGWPAGTTSPDYFTMERINPFQDGSDAGNWESNDGITTNGEDANGNSLNGTAKSQNSLNITVDSPNGGEDWSANSSHYITWSSTGAIDNVKIEYSTDSGSAWTIIEASTTNDGSYSWFVSNTLSANCLVKISDVLDGSPLDQSNEVFTISEATAVEITAYQAKVQENQILIEWSSASTGNIAGFNLYRGLNETNDYVKINPAMIPINLGETGGTTYSYADTPEEFTTYFFKLEVIDIFGNSSFFGPITVNFLTSVTFAKCTIPDKYFLSQNFPNPFNPETKIEYSLPKADFVTLSIYNISGHLVRNLVEEHKTAGNHSVIWDAKNNNRVKVSSGVYFYSFKTGDHKQFATNVVLTKKMILMK